MKLHPLREAPPAWLAEALERLEARFTYPLGEKVRFRIRHGRDYMPFFKAMGDATVWVAERGGEVLGTLAAIPRTIHLPDGQSQRTAYLCDLKITSGPHAGRTLATLAQTVNTALAGIGIRSAYSVVMTGTLH